MTVKLKIYRDPTKGDKDRNRYFIYMGQNQRATYGVSLNFRKRIVISKPHAELRLVVTTEVDLLGEKELDRVLKTLDEFNQEIFDHNQEISERTKR
jgi:hypothetical protein